MKTVISNDPAPIGERCFLCEETLTPPWFKTGKFRMHTACRDLVREYFEDPALNNASNVVQYYKDLGEKVSIEVVTFGSGLHMLRDDTSPEKAANRGARAEQRRKSP
jgi:hypothetical protein